MRRAKKIRRVIQQRKTNQRQFWDGIDMPYHDLMASILELPEGKERRELLEDMAPYIEEMEHRTGAAEGSALEEESLPGRSRRDGQGDKPRGRTNKGAKG